MSSSQSGSSQADSDVPPGSGLTGQFRSTQEENAFERWRSSLARFTGMGLSDEDKASREKLKGLELEESQWKRCEAWKTDLMRNSPVVVFMLKHLASENAKLTPAHIHCAPCDATRAGGFSPEAGILLCQDRFMSKRHMQDTLVHEMVHVYDHAKFNVDWGNLRHHACSEIRAASLSGDCRWSRETQRGFMAFSKQHQACARRRAILSVIANPACKSPEEAERAVNEVWESCFKDTRPFDEWHSSCDSNSISIVMGSPPKPWERAGTMAALADPAPPVPSMAASTITPSSSDAPAVPTRPDSITPQAPITSLSPFSSNTYGSSYSPYNRFGSYGSSYGGYGGSMYGGSMYGGGMYGGGMYGGGMYGQPQYGLGMDPSLTQSVAASTQQAFGLLGNVVGTFTSFAQMLDSSFMATQSSIFAILGVADQLSQLRALVGQVAGVFGLVGWLRGWFSREKRGTMAADFKKFMKGDDGPRPSKKPFIIILLAIFGLPYVMHKLVRALSTRLPPPVEQFDMSKVQFATALFDFTTSDQLELGLKRGDLVAIVGRTEGGDWFRGRTREGKQGWFPANHVQIIKKDAVKKVDEPKTV